MQADDAVDVMHRAEHPGADGLGYGRCTGCGELWPCTASRRPAPAVSRETCACGMPELQHPRQYVVPSDDPRTVNIAYCDEPLVLWSGEVAVGMPTDERALADRMATGCLLRRGELCPCPAPPFAYDGCERIKAVG